MQNHICKMDFKSFDEDSDRKIGIVEGYGSVFGVKDSYNDIVDKGAFEESLRVNGNPAMLLHHGFRDLAGVWVEAREDDKGLYLKGEINLEVQQAREAYSLIKQGAYDGLSIGFITLDDHMDQDEVRHISKVNLLEVSFVAFPANKEATITDVRNCPQTPRDLENVLRDAGYGRSQAKAIVAKGYDGYKSMQRDAEDDMTDVKNILKQTVNLF